MSTTVKISHINGIEIKMLQVPDPNGSMKPLHLSQINGVLLIHVSDLCKYFNESRSALYTHFANGRLKRYHPNGLEKINGSPRKLMIDFNAWLRLDESENKPPAKVHPRKIVIRLGGRK